MLNTDLRKYIDNWETNEDRCLDSDLSNYFRNAKPEHWEEVCGLAQSLYASMFLKESDIPEIVS